MKNKEKPAHEAPTKGDTAAIAVQAVCTLARMGGGSMGVTHAAFTGAIVEAGTKERVGDIGVTLGGCDLQLYDARDGSVWQIPVAALWRAYELGRLAMDLEQVERVEA